MTLVTNRSLNIPMSVNTLGFAIPCKKLQQVSHFVLRSMAFETLLVAVATKFAATKVEKLWVTQS